MGKIVAKFGGSSLADASQIKKVKDIILSNADRRYIVVSAAGKRNKADTKITDLLINYHKNKDNKNELEIIKNKLRERYTDIVNGLQIDFDVDKELNDIFDKEENEVRADYIVSRGEFLSARMISLYLGATFLDMQDKIIFNDNNKVDNELTYKNIKTAIDKLDNSNRIIVIPGFYGSNRNGDIVTFSRGGSDITGAIVARAINADVYENWTDVSGVMFSDPRIANEAKPIEYITYIELRELSYMGATVLHEETIYPVSKVGIPIHILNTNFPDDAGTVIVSKLPSGVKRRVVTGIAGKKGFSAILLHKALMNDEIGYLARLLNIFDRENIPMEHCPTSIDSVSIVLESIHLNGRKDKILNSIREELVPDTLKIEENISLIAIVGEDIAHRIDVIMKIFKVLSDANIIVKMIDQCPSGMNVIIGVSDSDYEKTIKALCTLQDISV